MNSPRSSFFSTYVYLSILSIIQMKKGLGEELSLRNLLSVGHLNVAMGIYTYWKLIFK